MNAIRQQRRNCQRCLVAAAVLAAATPALAVVQTYSNATGEPTLEVTHPGGGFYQSDGDFDSGLVGEFVFGGAANGFHQLAKGYLNQGYTGQTGDNAGYLLMDYTTGAQANFWFGGIGNDIGPLPTTNYSNVVAWVDVIAPAGAPMEFRVESDYGPFSGNGFKFSFVGTGTWQTVGGTLATATTFGNFDPLDPNLAALVAFGANDNGLLVDDGTNPANQPTVIIDNLTLTPGQSNWTNVGGGVWSSNGNWSTLAPDGANAVADFAGAILSPSTVTVDGQRFAGTVRFNNANSYTLAGSGPLSLRSIGSNAAIDVVQGSHTISAPVQLWSNTNLQVTPAASVLTLSGAITAFPNVTVSKSGAGRADVSNLNVTGINVQAGTLKLLSGSGTSRTNTLTIAGGSTPTAKLDISNNALVINNGAGQQPTIAAQVRSAFAGGAWSGNGITSSNADTTNFSVGYAQASDLTSVPPIFGSVGANAMLVRYTRFGDADLNGTVGLDDFNRLASNFNGTGKFWSEGNFNHDPAGAVNLDDFNLLAGNFNLSAAGPEVTPEDWAALAAAIPEPSALVSLCGFAAAYLMRPRRRRAR